MQMHKYEIAEPGYEVACLDWDDLLDKLQSKFGVVLGSTIRQLMQLNLDDSGRFSICGEKIGETILVRSTERDMSQDNMDPVFD